MLFRSAQTLAVGVNADCSQALIGEGKRKRQAYATAANNRYVEAHRPQVSRWWCGPRALGCALVGKEVCLFRIGCAGASNPGSAEPGPIGFRWDLAHDRRRVGHLALGAVQIGRI